VNIYSGRAIDEGYCNECRARTIEVFVLEVESGISMRFCRDCMESLRREVTQVLDIQPDPCPRSDAAGGAKT